MNEKINHGNDEVVLISYREVIRNYLREMKQFWWLIFILTIGMAVGMYCYARLTYKPMYQSKASFTVVTSDLTNGDYMYTYNQYSSSQLSTTFPYILQSDLLLNRVKEDLETDELNGTVSVNALNDSNLFTIVVTSDKKEDAKAIIDSILDHYAEVAEYVIGDTKLNILETPGMPEKPYNNPNLTGNMSRGALFGMAIAMFIIFLHVLSRRTIKKESEVQNILNVACLGSVPKVFFKKLHRRANENLSINNDQTGSFFQESVRGIALRLVKQMQEKEEKVLMVTSTIDGEGVSSIAENLSFAIAETGNKVLFIDSKQEKNREIKPRYTLEQYTTGACTFNDLIYKDSTANVSYLLYEKSKKANAYEAICALKKLIKQLREEMDLIVIDAPSCAEMGEAVMAAEYSDSVLYVVKQDEVIVRKIKECIEDICSYGVSFSGCVLNQVRADLSEHGYGKYGYGKYGYGKYGYGKYGYGKYGYGNSKHKKS